MKTQSLSFDQLVNFANGKNNKPITSKQFELWKQDFTFNALHGQRYGQSFCNRFGITDYLLYYNQWSIDQLDDYIEKNYIKQS